MVRISDKPMIIYFVFNKNDEIVYIGQTVMTLAQRKGKHLSEARKGRGSILGAGIRKHGEKYYRFEKHSIYFNQIDLDEAEKHYIKKYTPRYNVQEGGKKSFEPWNKGKKETRPEVLENIKLGAKDRKRTKRGSYTEEHKEKISKAGRRARIKPFICHENNKIYETKMDAAEDLGIDPRGITAVLNPKTRNKSHKGYTFSYID